MAVKETHKEPERLTDKVSAFDSANLISSILLYFHVKTLIFGVGLCFCNWHCLSLQLALACVKTMRGGFDWLSGYNKPNRGEAVWVK